ncbi:XdhC family protein [Algihabitans albus]|uniref:XdhC family protein n=1 Tax=Algihabitans albus TaxID=2164067 RepID=UPI000E5C9004|nr:XdhC family protein [Algihabitans albus]
MRQALLDRLLTARKAKQPVVLATDLNDGRQALLDAERVDGDLRLSDAELQAARAALRNDVSGRLPPEVSEDRQIFLQVFNPPLRLVVVGAVHISQALVPMAQILGFDVAIVDPRPAFATEQRFPGVRLVDEWPDDAMALLKPDRRTAVVTLTHDPKLDDPALTEALKSESFYIGALGSTRTHAKRLERLRAAGLGESELARIQGPAGLAIGAKSPAEIALSVCAQMTAALRAAPPLIRAQQPAAAQ